MKAVNYQGAVLQTGPAGGGGGGGTFLGGFSTMGNTAGNTGVVSDRLVLVGSNNITLSGSTNAGSITVSIIGAAGGGGAMAISAAGNSVSAGTVVFSNSNNVSFGMAGSTVTGTASFAQTNQQMTLFATGNTTQSSTGTTNASSIVFRGAGDVSVGITGGSIVLSVTQSNQAFSADASSAFQTLVFQDSNGISFSNNAGSLRLTHGLQFTSNTSAITSNAMNSTSRPAFSADASSTFQTLTFQNSNGVSFSNNAGALRITHDLQFTSNTSNITSNALNTSASRVMNILAATNNTGGGTASLSSNVSFSNANGATFYTSAGNAIVLSYTVPTAGAAITVSDAATSGTIGRLAFTNLNGVTLSLSTGAGGSHTIVGSHNALTSQSNQAFSAAGGSSAFQTLSFSDNAQASFTNNAGQLAITNVRLSLSATGNTTQSSTGTLNASSIILRGSNIVSVGISNGSIIVDATQSNQAFSAAGGSSAFQTLSFGDTNSVSFTNTNGSVGIASIKLQMFAVSNTTQSSSGTANHTAISFAGAGIASVGVSGGSVVISVPAGGGGGDGGVGLGVSTGGDTSGNTGTFSTGTFVLQGSNSLTLQQSTGGAGIHTIFIKPAMSQLTAGNNISLSTAGSTISIIGLAQSMSLYATGNTTQSSSGTMNLSSMIFRGSNNVSVGISNGSIIIDATAAGGGGGGVTLQGANPYDDLVQVAGQVGQASLLLDPQHLPNISFDRIQMFLHNTNSSNSSGSHTLSFWFGLYTRNASTLSLYTSFSGSTAVTHSGTAGSYSWYSGYRLFPITFAATSIPEDRYWIGYVSRTTSGGTNGSYSNFLCSNINSQFTGLFGTASNATMQPKLGQGFYTATTSGMPGSIAFTQINGTVSNARRFPAIGFGSGTV